MGVYIFRAECLSDVLSFLAKVGVVTRVIACQMRQDSVFPDVEVEIHVAYPLDKLRAIAEMIPDLHVVSDSLSLKPIRPNQTS